MGWDFGSSAKADDQTDHKTDSEVKPADDALEQLKVRNQRNEQGEVIVHSR